MNLLQLGRELVSRGKHSLRGGWKAAALAYSPFGRVIHRRTTDCDTLWLRFIGLLSKISILSNESVRIHTGLAVSPARAIFKTPLLWCVPPLLYNVHMPISATEFRKNLFTVLERVLAGETVDIIYKGAAVRVSAGSSSTKLSSAKRRDTLL